MTSLKNNYVFELGGTLLVGGTTVNISNDLELSQTVTFTNASVVFRNRDASLIERAIGTATGGVLTLSKRGLVQENIETENPALQKEWKEGTRCYVTILASQMLDAKGDNTFLGTQTFNNIDVNGDTTLEDTIITGKYRGPVVADVTARNALYPTPLAGDEVYVVSLNAKQVYNGTTTQWESLDIGTPPPPASEGVSGILPLATNTETLIGTNDTKAITPLKLKNITTPLETPEALFEKDEYIAGETILANDSLFVESLPTFAESTLLQNIGDVTGNTRVAILGFGSGVASNTLKLSLRKFVSPSANLSVRIETVSGGNPTGTLVNTNATATVTSASITTSLVDTTITLAGSITITKGQQVAIVLSQVGDVVNATNYYAVGYVARDTSTRKASTRNGIIWSIPSIYTNNAHTRVPDTTASVNAINGFIIQSNINGFLNQVIKSTTSTATRALLYASNGTTLLGTAPFVGNIATFSLALVSGTQYRVGVDNSGASYTSHRVFAGGYPQNYSNINYINGATGTGNMTTTDTSNWYDILSISTSISVPTMFNYISSTLFENRVLAETSATYSYKLPTDYVRIATQGYNVGQSVTSKYYGLHTYPGLVSNTAYYIANTPGAISAVAGSNKLEIGRTNKSTILDISDILIFNGLTLDTISGGTNISLLNNPSLLALTGTTTPQTIYTYTFTRTMNIQLDWQYRQVSGFGGQTANSGAFRNGVLYSGGFSSPGATTSFQNASFTGYFEKGDVLEIRLRTNVNSDTLQFQNFTARYNRSTSVFYLNGFTL